MTNEFLYTLTGIAALFIGYALWLKHQLRVALAREAVEAEAKPDVKTFSNTTFHVPMRSAPFIRITSGSILVSNDSRGGLIVAFTPVRRSVASPSGRGEKP